MGRRNDIDWEKIQRLYIAGQMTIREIAAECGVGASSVTLKAKQQGWQRNISEAIKARTKAKIAQIDVQELIEKSSLESAQQSAQTIQKAIEEASDVAAGIIRKHRAVIKITEDRASAVEAVLDETMSQAEGIRDVVAATQALKALVDVRKTLIALERQSFNLDDAQEDNEDDGPIEIQVNLVSGNGEDQG